MRPFESLREYERFVYSLTNQFPKILRSTLVVVQRGRCFAELIGEIIFPDGYRLNVYERLSWDAGPLTIEGYSYEVWFLEVYYNEVTETIAFALIEEEKRIRGIDRDNIRDWHIHPLEAPETHESTESVSVYEIVEELKEVWKRLHE